MGMKSTSYGIRRRIKSSNKRVSVRRSHGHGTATVVLVYSRTLPYSRSYNEDFPVPGTTVLPLHSELRSTGIVLRCSTN
jgi:hypothetical protein